MFKMMCGQAATACTLEVQHGNLRDPPLLMEETIYSDCNKATVRALFWYLGAAVVQWTAVQYPECTFSSSLL
jgi:hypothetical protein